MQLSKVNVTVTIYVHTDHVYVYIRAKGLGQNVDQHCTGWRNVCGCGALRKSPASGNGKSSQNLEPESIVAVNRTGVAPGYSQPGYMRNWSRTQWESWSTVESERARLEH